MRGLGMALGAGVMIRLWDVFWEVLGILWEQMRPTQPFLGAVSLEAAPCLGTP